MNNDRLYRPAAIMAGAMLVLALASWPYGYYQYLRIVVCGVTGFGSLLAYRRRSSWVWVLGGLAILFNPILPIYLDRTTWAFLDLISASILFLSTRALKIEEDTTNDKKRCGT